jgi:septal ring factor EnvC (AmiA/AmiB activator)
VILPKQNRIEMWTSHRVFNASLLITFHFLVLTHNILRLILVSLLKLKHMKRIHFISILLIFSFLAFSTNSLFAQKAEKAKLEAEQKQLHKKIKKTRLLIQETKNKRRASLNEISLLNNQINNRKALIRSYGLEIQLIERQVDENKRLIGDLNNELVSLKKEYGRLIEQSYKTRNKMDKWVFIFSSEDFYQGFQRFKYIERIGDFRKDKVERIIKAQEELIATNELLGVQKQERVDVMIEKETETSSLNRNKQNKQRKANELRSRENELRNKLKKQQQQDAVYRKKIKELIKKLARGKQKNGNREKKTDWEIALAKNFTANKGKLPWPTPNGSVISKYGKHPHPDFPNLVLVNDGVDIRCEKGTISRAVFKGEVIGIMTLPTKGKAVLVNHGDYITVYKNLSDVYVVEGDKLDTKQEIGLVYTDNNTKETVLHFEIYKTTGDVPQTQNPAGWIYRLK